MGVESNSFVAFHFEQYIKDFIFGRRQKSGEVLVTDGFIRSGVTTASHLQIAGGVLSVVVSMERRYGPCWLSVNNNNYEPSHYIMLLSKGPR